MTAEGRRRLGCAVHRPSLAETAHMPIAIMPNAGLGYIVKMPFVAEANKMLWAEFPGNTKWSAPDNGYMIKGTGQGIVEALERFTRAAGPVVEGAETERAKAVAFIAGIDKTKLPGIELEVKQMGLGVRLPNVKAATDALSALGHGKWVPPGPDVEANGVAVKQGNYYKMPVTDQTMAVLRIAALELQKTNQHALAATKIPHHDAVRISTAMK